MAADEKTPLLSSSDNSKIPSQVGFAPEFMGDHDKAVPLVPIKQLFRFSDSTDVILITLGVLGSICYGAITPAQFILFGRTTDDFVEYSIWDRNRTSPDPPVDLEDSMTDIAIWYIGFAVANFLFAWMGMGLFALSAERQVHKMRLAMFRNVIYQEIGWFDEQSSGELIIRLSDDLTTIADGMGFKFGRLLSNIVAFIAGYVIGFMYVWQLTLLMLGLLPVIAFAGALMTKTNGNYTAKELEAYAKAGHVAEQSISSVRTVTAFGAEEKQAELYEKNLEIAGKYGIKKGFSMGVGIGVITFISLCNYALSIWYVIKLVRDDDASAGDGIMVFLAVTTSSSMLGQVGGSTKALGAAKSAAYTIFKIIDRESQIDASSNAGHKPAVINGNIELSHIDFVYPTRPSVEVLKDFSLNIPSGKRVALVGESGCGKSTVVKLIQRFYDPVKGSVLLDGQDIKSLNVRHLRRFIGVVNQEPVLFATTIAENIAYGREGVTQQEIEEAAKMANAHDFIKQFPQGYNTLCGERGAKMSGGQKQRIAIARALVRNPKILLLDEATSALDSESEAVVQEALDRACKGRTTIIIAHRLSTIQNADVIVAVRDGCVAEIGTHKELMALGGLYSSLVKLQGKYIDNNEKDDDSADEEGNSLEIGEDGAFKLGSIATTISGQRSKILQSEEDDDLKPVSLIRILKMNYPEWKYLLIGGFGAALYGCYPPLFSFAFGKLYEAFSYDRSDPSQRDEMEDDSHELAVLYLAIGVGCGLGAFLKDFYLAKAGEALTERLRKQSFLAYLRQEISYYDEPSHNTGAICTALAVEVSSVKGATGSQLGLIASSLMIIIGGLIISFDATWQVTLVMLAFLPLLIIAGKMLKLNHGADTSDKALIGAGQTAEEVLSNIQTVVSLGQEDGFFERYRQEMIVPYRIAKRHCHLAGLATGSFMGIICLSDAAAFRYGGYLVTEGDITLKEMMTAIITVIMCAIFLGHVASLTPDFMKAKQAAARVFYLLDTVPPIDSYSNAGKQPDFCNGDIQFTNVRFNYPTRRNFKVLRNLNLTINQGQTVALVGTSGCGKSTSVSLVERFYDVISGNVMVDGNDVKDLNLRWLRSQIGIVSQEPVLFDMSIRDNIAFGDTTRYVSDKEIEAAARSANIHPFISSLPKGYDTIVGDKGTLISGGQKQRVAIARALIRDPKILLLDEATSALDTESEKVVQQALDKASIGRTTLIIAHRLSTIQHADCIFVIKKGRVVERGTHQQLLALNGVYNALHTAQSLAGKDA